MGLTEIKQTETIRIKQSKAGLFGGLFFILVAVIMNVCLVCIDGGPPIIVVLIGMVFIWGYFGLIGGHLLYSYFKLGQGLRAAIKRYGDDYLIAHIKQSAVKKYSNFMPGTTVYFTDRFVIAPGSAVFEYSSIGRMYKQMDYSGKVATSCLTFEISDGPDVVLCHGITDAEIIEVMQLCQRYNKSLEV